jgi:YidC/Oxa1 family membrane protein insertase
VDLLGVPDLPDLTASAWTLTPAGDGLRAEIAAGGLLFWKQITVSRDSAHPWHADVTVGIRNVSAAAGAARTLEVVGPATPRPNPLFIDDGVLLESAGESPEELTVQGVQELLAENPRLEKRPPTGKWSWIGVRSGFHAAALLPLDPLPADTTVGLRMVGVTEPGHGVRPVVAPTFRLPVTIPQPGSEATFRFRMFAGPNQRSLFTEDGSPYAVLRGVTVNRKFLWMSFQPLSNLLAWLLKILADTGMGYGMAVIALTVLVRGVLFPLSRKSQVSMRLHGLRMGRLKPKLDAIKEKYKDPKKQQEMTMKLFREEKVSLLPGGCLLIFLQMPIWISLYSVLQTTYEMRHASFLWAADLTAPDHLLHLPFFANVPLVPEWLNLLPLLMMLTWTWSSLMQPLPPDPQQAQQAKIMRWMPLLFGFFLYSTASGLTLYMTMSAIWSIGETTLIKKVWLAKIDKSLA